MKEDNYEDNLEEIVSNINLESYVKPITGHMYQRALDGIPDKVMFGYLSELVDARKDKVELKNKIENLTTENEKLKQDNEELEKELQQMHDDLSDAKELKSNRELALELTKCFCSSHQNIEYYDTPYYVYKKSYNLLTGKEK